MNRQNIMDCEMCQNVDGRENHGNFIQWQLIEDGAITSYRCNIHLTQDDIEDPDYNTTGWEEVNNQ